MDMIRNLARTVIFTVLLVGALCIEDGCKIDFDCEECVSEDAPLLESEVRGGRLSEGEEVQLACRGGRFMAFPLQERIVARCENGRLRVPPEKTPRHPLELICQDAALRDVRHAVRGCGSPAVGRAYTLLATRPSAPPRHLAELCYDADRGIAVHAHVSPSGIQMPPHNERSAPMSLFGGLEDAFETRTLAAAERLLGDEVAMNRRLDDLAKWAHADLAGETLQSAPLLPREYFVGQEARVAAFPSNRVAVWRSVTLGNLKRMQRDVAAALAQAPHLHVFAGTHGTGYLRGGNEQVPISLKPPSRFPVPRYLWTVLWDKKRGAAEALVLLNDPFAAVAEIREAVFCESGCSRLPWLRESLSNAAYETPLFGLLFCCDVHDFAREITELPNYVRRNVTSRLNNLA